MEVGQVAPVLASRMFSMLFTFCLPRVSVDETHRAPLTFTLIMSLSQHIAVKPRLYGWKPPCFRNFLTGSKIKAFS